MRDNLIASIYLLDNALARGLGSNYYKIIITLKENSKLDIKSGEPPKYLEIDILIFELTETRVLIGYWRNLLSEQASKCLKTKVTIIG